VEAAVRVLGLQLRASESRDEDSDRAPNSMRLLADEASGYFVRDAPLKIVPDP
jgi:hypothetical protein